MTSLCDKSFHIVCGMFHTRALLSIVLLFGILNTLWDHHTRSVTTGNPALWGFIPCYKSPIHYASGYCLVCCDLRGWWELRGWRTWLKCWKSVRSLPHYQGYYATTLTHPVDLYLALSLWMMEYTTNHRSEDDRTKNTILLSGLPRMKYKHKDTKENFFTLVCVCVCV